MDPTTSLGTTNSLDAVRTRRAELRDSIGVLERALAAPAGDRAVVWGEGVHAAVSMLADDLIAHIEVTEGADGLHQSILSGDLRLTNAVLALTVEHESMVAETAALVRDTSAPVVQEQVGDLRERATRLLGHLVRHRQRGADLIYEAYATDIGGVD